MRGLRGNLLNWLRIVVILTITLVSAVAAATEVAPHVHGDAEVAFTTAHVATDPTAGPSTGESGQHGLAAVAGFPPLALTSASRVALTHPLADVTEIYGLPPAVPVQPPRS